MSRKALGSVSKIVANGNKVVFDESGSFIEQKIKRKIMDAVKTMACMSWTCMWHHLMTTTGRVFTGRDFVRPFDEKSRKGVSGSRNILGVLSEAGPAAGDQMESDSDMSRERILRERERRRHEDQSCGQQGRFR